MLDVLKRLSVKIHGFRITVVEDSETQAFKLQVLLEEQGWEVCLFGTAEAALASLGDPRPDLILVDYNLPGIRGDEFCRRIRMNLNTRGIPLLMMTGSAPETAEIQSLDSGADGYVSKSESSDILLLRIRALLRESSATDAVLNTPDASFRRASILIIDDSPTCLASLSHELRNQGYQIKSAPNGRDGLREIEAQNFDCVLVDLVTLLRLRQAVLRSRWRIADRANYRDRDFAVRVWAEQR